MQFLPATFGEFAVDADPAQPVSPYDPADAIYTAARMLCADGARGAGHLPRRAGHGRAGDRELISPGQFRVLVASWCRHLHSLGCGDCT